MTCAGQFRFNLIQRKHRTRRVGTVTCPLPEQAWWREGWQATAAPAKETTAKLIPIVTTQETPTIDAIELAQTYIHRWPAQENIIKDYLLPLGLDTNHGFAKVAVEYSEGTKRRTHLEQRLARLRQWAQSAGKREAQASQRRERLRKTFTGRSKELYQELWAYQRTLEEQGLANHVLRQQVKERKAIADAELEHLRAKEWRAYAQATWKRLLPFFQLPGTITQDATLVQVELRPFNDRMLNRDLVILCDRVNQASPRLPDGRRLSFTIRSSGCILAAQKVGKIP